jgi:predicted nucleic acid-binding protein
MKILVDTNILISALLFPHSKPSKVLLYVSQYHNIVLCDQNLFELRDVLKRKAPSVLPDSEVLLAELSYELIPTATIQKSSYGMPKISLS